MRLSDAICKIAAQAVIWRWPLPWRYVCQDKPDSDIHTRMYSTRSRNTWEHRRPAVARKYQPQACTRMYQRACLVDCAKSLAGCRGDGNL